MTKEEAGKLLKRKKRASEYADYCASVGACNSDGDVHLLYQSKDWWEKARKISEGCNYGC